MMLAYQPVRSLATINMAVNQGLTAARRILPIIDNENEIKDKKNAEDILIKNANINTKMYSLNTQRMLMRKMF